MALYRTRAVVVQRRALGESDRLIEFYTRAFGKVRGVARRGRSRQRQGSALEPLTVGELLFFDTGRSELVRVDQFDIAHPFLGVREDLGRLGRGAWVLECVSRLSPERDPHPPLFALIVRSLRALEAAVGPDRVGIGFALRLLDLLGHRPRLDACVACGRSRPFTAPRLDVNAGGLVCDDCRPGADALALSPGALGAIRRLRAAGWEEGLSLPLAPRLTRELSILLDGSMARLIGRVPRASRFLAQTAGPWRGVAEPPPAGAR